MFDNLVKLVRRIATYDIDTISASFYFIAVTGWVNVDGKNIKKFVETIFFSSLFIAYGS
jgi:hypothetical protein